MLVIALFLLTSGHPGVVVSQQPCCSAVGHCLVPLAPCGLSHLVRRVSQLPCSLKLNFSVVLAACCTLNPGCQDLGFFCRSFLRGTLSSSDQASVPSDALVKPRLDILLMSRRRALGSGLFGCFFFVFVTNPFQNSLRIQTTSGAPANDPAGLGWQRHEQYRPSLSLQCQASFVS